jgi:hypothetical protein
MRSVAVGSEEMSMKEDVLEQIVDDYLQLKGYFTTHNVRFKPSAERRDYDASKDSVHSDVDVVGVNPRKRGTERVWVVSCKAWQGGFRADHKLRQLRGEAAQGKRETWKYVRELWAPKWAEAFRETVYQLTGSRTFHYWLAVTKLTGDPEAWNQDKTIRKNLGGNPIGFLTLEAMWSEYVEAVGTTVQPSEIGRLAQLLKAAGVTERA